MFAFRNKRRGFTLIEIITVVAIIAILTAVAVPAYVLYKEKSKASVAKSSASAVIETVNYYFAINGLGVDSSGGFLVGSGTGSSLSVESSTFGEVMSALTDNDMGVNVDSIDTNQKLDDYVYGLDGRLFLKQGDVDWIALYKR